VVLKGHKELGKNNEIICPSENFVFLSDNSVINMRNIPKDDAYFALLIEFDCKDFKEIPHIGNHSSRTLNSDYFIGDVTPILKNCLQ
jgi:hypothetical protein